MKPSRVVRFGAIASATLAIAAMAACPGSGPRPDPSSDPRPTGTETESRAVRFLGESDAADDVSVSLILDYLRRRFEVAGLSAQIAYGEEIARDPDEQMFLYRRLFDPTAKLQEFASPEAAGIDPARLASVAYLPLLALHCDRWPLPREFGAELARESERGGYHATHALLALQWATEQGCEVGDNELREMLRAKLIEIAERQARDDLFAEALAMLYYGGDGDTVRPEWNRTLAESQGADGSFPFSAAGGGLVRHSTALGLWAILASEGRGDPSVTWIPFPG